MNDMIEPVGFFGQIKTKISLFGNSCEKIEIGMVALTNRKFICDINGGRVILNEVKTKRKQ